MQKDKNTSCKADKKENGVQKEKKTEDDINDGKRRQEGLGLGGKSPSGAWISVSKMKR